MDFWKAWKSNGCKKGASIILQHWPDILNSNSSTCQGVFSQKWLDLNQFSMFDYQIVYLRMSSKDVQGVLRSIFWSTALAFAIHIYSASCFVWLFHWKKGGRLLAAISPTFHPNENLFLEFLPSPGLTFFWVVPILKHRSTMRSLRSDPSP